MFILLILYFLQEIETASSADEMMCLRCKQCLFLMFVCSFAIQWSAAF